LLQPGSFVFIDDRLRMSSQASGRMNWNGPSISLNFEMATPAAGAERKGDDPVLIAHPFSSRFVQIYPVSQAEIIEPVWP
jgi:hypothetical protein